MFYSRSYFHYLVRFISKNWIEEVSWYYMVLLHTAVKPETSITGCMIRTSWYYMVLLHTAVKPETSITGCMIRTSWYYMVLLHTAVKPETSITGCMIRTSWYYMVLLHTAVKPETSITGCMIRTKWTKWTPWRRVFKELIVVQLVKKLRIFIEFVGSLQFLQEKDAILLSSFLSYSYSF
jgi:hypothetical protein